MKELTESQKKLYLLLGMVVLGGVLLFSLNGFKASEQKEENTISEGNMVSPEADFNITLDTLNSKDRKAFYRKDRDTDTIELVDPFVKKEESTPSNRILQAANELENKPTTPKSSKTKINEDLWDMDTEEDTSNLGLENVLPVETEEERRRKILEANRRQSELYSSSQKSTPTANSLSINAAVYRDQFILPGDDVELITTEDVEYNGKIIPKNTVIIASSEIKKNRVLLEVNNIHHTRISLVAEDYRAGGIGIKSKRAGELWSEASKQLENNLAQDIAQEASQETGRVGRGIARTIAQIFRRKNLKKNDKILLVNDHQVILIPQTQ